MTYEKVVVYSDGASRGNPGPASAGWVICDLDGNIIARDGTCLGRQTNNVAEYEAAIRGLRHALSLGASMVLLRADSELMIKQLRGDYQVRNANILPLFATIQELIKQFKRFGAEHIPREHNREADQEANAALDRQSR